MIRELLVELSLRGQVIAEVGVILLASCLLGAVTIIGRSRLVELAADFKPRLRESAPYLGVLAGVLVLNFFLREPTQELSWAINLNITDIIWSIEGDFVAVIQSFETELLTQYFSIVYVYGYAFLLVFPLLAYLALSDRTTFKRLVVAYSLNYFIGLALYIIFIAYGPRNTHPEVFQNLIYDLVGGADAGYQFLTAEVNAHTNVFPSLHTSLSATVAIFAYRTREEYRSWLAIATVLAVSITISTMYLGIHWATDVVAGLALAGLCVYLAERYIGDD